MSLRPLADVSAASWFSEDVTLTSANLGPPGYEAYARVLHEGDDGDRREGHLGDSSLTALCHVLARHTSTPDVCYFGLWDGFGDLQGGDAVGFLVAFSGPMRWPGRVFRPERKPPPPPPAFPDHVLNGPKIDMLGLQHLLFCGPLGQAGKWGATPYGPGHSRDINSPNLMWPADHAWFVTTNIDSTWTGVGGSVGLVEGLLAEHSLEVVRTRYDHGTHR